MHLKRLALSILSVAFVSTAGSAFAVTNFTETFNTNASGWLNGASGAPIYNATGGVGDSGYISYAPADFNSGSGGFGDPLALMFRAMHRPTPAVTRLWATGSEVESSLSP